MIRTRIEFRNIDWALCYEQVFKIQQQIAVAWKSGDLKLVSLLQDQLKRSFSARALAVRKVITNDGSKTPGVDKVIWDNDQQHTAAIKRLSNLSGYEAEPVRRVYIPKAKGTFRPLGPVYHSVNDSKRIPTMFDRAVQALYALSLIPIAEQTADLRSYGYRPYHGVHDAAVYLKLVLSSYTGTRRWILEGDISKFFDKISHDWLMKNIPMRKEILEQFLKAGFVEGFNYHETIEGTPQGGIISPILGNMVLDGLEPLLKPKFLIVRYADDFVVLGPTEESLKHEAIPKVEAFLKIRGLVLNLRKTSIIPIEKGFNFLGFHFREYPDKSRIQGTKKGIFLIKPAKDKVLGFRKKISNLVKDYSNKPLYVLITKLNIVLRGWSEHYRTITAKKTFTAIGKHVFIVLWKMVRKKHRGVPLRKLKQKYFTSVENNHWVCLDSRKSQMTLFQIGWVAIKRHLLCQSLNPWLPENEAYFKARVARSARVSILLNKQATNLRQKGFCPVCRNSLLYEQNLEVHHILPKKDGGKDIFNNLLLLRLLT